MVTKLIMGLFLGLSSSVLAKILMVTKRHEKREDCSPRSVLAKILMVTKQAIELDADKFGSVLAKILMVTKRRCFL